jgi:hypothetical protein
MMVAQELKSQTPLDLVLQKSILNFRNQHCELDYSLTPILNYVRNHKPLEEVVAIPNYLKCDPNYSEAEILKISFIKQLFEPDEMVTEQLTEFNNNFSDFEQLFIRTICIPISLKTSDNWLVPLNQYTKLKDPYNKTHAYLLFSVGKRFHLVPENLIHKADNRRNKLEKQLYKIFKDTSLQLDVRIESIAFLTEYSKKYVNNQKYLNRFSNFIIDNQNDDGNWPGERKEISAETDHTNVLAIWSIANILQKTRINK